jgi:hypothetical protein
MWKCLVRMEVHGETVEGIKAWMDGVKGYYPDPISPVHIQNVEGNIFVEYNILKEDEE